MNRVWIFVIASELDESELAGLQEKGNAFVKGWTAHENRLTASFEIFQNRVIIVKVNEDVHGASGCSIDKLTRFIKECSSWLGTDLMDRLQVVYENGSKIEVVKADRIPELLRSGVINPETTVLNTAASTENELKDWRQPLKNTWLKKYLVNA